MCSNIGKRYLCNKDDLDRYEIYMRFLKWFPLKTKSEIEICKILEVPDYAYSIYLYASAHYFEYFNPDEIEDEYCHVDFSRFNHLNLTCIQKKFIHSILEQNFMSNWVVNTKLLLF